MADAELHPPKPTGIVAVLNPGSGRYDEAEAFLTAVQEGFSRTLPLERVVTHPDVRITGERLRAAEHRLGESTLLLILGGDETGQAVATYLSSPETPDHVRQSQAAFLPFGTASDTALALGEAATFADPFALADPQKRELRELHPAWVESEHPDGHTEKGLMVSYTGLGATGWGVMALDAVKSELRELWRQGKWLRHTTKEFFTAVLPGFYKPDFTVTRLGSPSEAVVPGTNEPEADEIFKRTFNLLWMNGPIIAKYGRSPASHHEPIIHESLTRAHLFGADRALMLCMYGLLLRAGRLPARRIRAADRPTYHVEPRSDQESVPLQIDGRKTKVRGQLSFSPALPFTVVTQRRTSKARRPKGQQES